MKQKSSISMFFEIKTGEFPEEKGESKEIPFVSLATARTENACRGAVGASGPHLKVSLSTSRLVKSLIKIIRGEGIDNFWKSRRQ